MFSPVIKWSGSKRLIAQKLVSYFPTFNTYYEPFLGGGSILYALQPHSGVCGDICEPLIKFWNNLKTNPARVGERYEREWNRLQKEGSSVFYEIRDRFNRKQTPEDLLFLSRTCVNGLIRFNKKGEFNNSFHHTRKGIKPNKLQKIIYEWSKKIQHIVFKAAEYQETTQRAQSGDFIYLDPPYFHTVGRYYGKIQFKEFIDYLYELKEREINFVLSYDGFRGEREYRHEIPSELYRRHIYIESGNSTFKKVMDKKVERVKESIYLSW